MPQQQHCADSAAGGGEEDGEAGVDARTTQWEEVEEAGSENVSVEVEVAEAVVH